MGRRPKLLLLGCVKGKRACASPAKELFTSELWKKRRAFAEATGQPWMLLSGKHGLVHPDTVLDPYDTYLGAQPREYRREWTERTARAVVDTCKRFGVRQVEVHAGATYADSRFQRMLADAGLEVSLPLAHVRQGEQLRWYASRTTRSTR